MKLYNNHIYKLVVNIFWLDDDKLKYIIETTYKNKTNQQ